MRPSAPEQGQQGGFVEDSDAELLGLGQFAADDAAAAGASRAAVATTRPSSNRPSRASASSRQRGLEINIEITEDAELGK